MLLPIINLQRIQKEVFSITDQKIELIVVSKNFPNDRIIPLLDYGHRIFAENKLQEAQAKWVPLKQLFPDIKLHLIGHLQSNKIKEALNLFDVIQTIDRISLAERLAEAMDRMQIFRDCFIQINTGEEPQKSGILPAFVDELILKCLNLRLPVKGLMCIPPLNEPPQPHFSMLKEIARCHQLPILSMGMSNDYRIAIKCGATHIRIGSAIFGNRE